jgi:tetratricopeptide (TPR) repeat protein
LERLLNISPGGLTCGYMPVDMQPKLVNLNLQSIFLLVMVRLQDLSYEDQILLGDAYHQLGDFESAEQVWRFALRSRKSSPEIYFRLADIHRAQEDIPTLINDLKSLITIQPNNAHIAFELGLLLSTQEPESALLYLEIAAKQDPKFNESARDLQSKINTAQLAEEPAYTLLEVGRSLAAMDEWKLASLAFRQATEIRADYAEAWAFLGEAQQHLSSISGASNTDSIGLTDLETALQLKPKVSHSQCINGYLLATAKSIRPSTTLHTLCF